MSADQLAQVAVVTESPGRVAVAITGEIDMSNADAVRDRIDALVGAVQQVTIDMSAVDYLDTRGVKLLASLAMRDDLALTLVAPPGCVARTILTITGLDKVIVVQPSLLAEV